MNLKQTIIRFAGLIRWLSIALIAMGFLLTVNAFPIENALASVRDWSQSMGRTGPVVFGLIYVAVSLVMLPAVLLMFVAGAIFGFFVGTLVVSLSATTAAAIAFLIARYAARRRIRRWVKRTPRFAAIDRAIGEGGAMIVALLRLSPALPHAISNYLFGLTRVRFWPYVLATWLFMLPTIIVYVYIGHFGAEGLMAPASGPRVRSPGEWAILILGLAATAAAAIYITQLTRKQLKKYAHVEPDLILSDSDRAGRPARWPWTTLGLAGLAIFWLISAAVVGRNGEAIRQFFDPSAGSTRLSPSFSPPAEDHKEPSSAVAFQHSSIAAPEACGK